MQLNSLIKMLQIEKFENEIAKFIYNKNTNSIWGGDPIPPYIYVGVYDKLQ